MEENGEKQLANDYHDNTGHFKEGNPGGGRPANSTLPPEKLAIRKATSQLIKEYKEALAEALPMIQPVLIAKALDGDLGSIKEISDRAMGKADQHTDITTNGESIIPVLVKFVDGQ